MQNVLYFFALLVKTMSARSPKTSDSAFLNFFWRLRVWFSEVSACSCAKANIPLRSGPAGRDSPPSALCFYLLRGKVKQCYMFLFVLLASIRGAAAQGKLELRRSALCARLLRRYSRSNILVAAYVKAGTTLCGNQSFTLCFCCLRLLLLEVFTSLSRVTQNQLRFDCLFMYGSPVNMLIR